MARGPTGTYSEHIIESWPQRCLCDLHNSVTFTTQANITMIFLCPTIVAEKLTLREKLRCLCNDTQQGRG